MLQRTTKPGDQAPGYPNSYRQADGQGVRETGGIHLSAGLAMRETVAMAWSWARE